MTTKSQTNVPTVTPLTVQSLSTNYNAVASMAALFPLFDLVYADYSNEQRRDYLAQMSRKIKRIRKAVPYVYQGYETLTTDVFKMYGSTTFVYIFLMYNAVHRLELEPGRRYLMPDISEIQKDLTKQTGSTPSKAGTVVIIP